MICKICIVIDVDTNFAHVVLCHELRIEMDYCLICLHLFTVSACGIRSLSLGCIDEKSA